MPQCYSRGPTRNPTRSVTIQSNLRRFRLRHPLSKDQHYNSAYHTTSSQVAYHSTFRQVSNPCWYTSVSGFDAVALAVGRSTPATTVAAKNPAASLTFRNLFTICVVSHIMLVRKPSRIAIFIMFVLYDDVKGSTRFLTRPASNLPTVRSKTMRSHMAVCGA